MGNLLEKDLRALLNRYSMENESNTPDFILAEYMLNCLAAFSRAVRARGQWYGRMDIPGAGSVPFDEATEPREIGVGDVIPGPIDAANSLVLEKRDE